MSRATIWLELGSVKIYRRARGTASRKGARAWADRQIALRDRLVAAQAELASR